MRMELLNDYQKLLKNNDLIYFMKKLVDKFKKREKYWFDKIKPFLGDENTNILKIGNGFGYMSEMIKQNHSKLTILDICIYPDMINKDSVCLYEGSHIPYNDESFYISVINQTLHHIPKSTKYFKEILRVTEKRIVLVETTYENIFQKIHLVWRDWYVNYKAGRSCKIYWNSYFSKEKITKLIEKDNLTLVYNYSEKHHSYYREIFILDK